MANAYNFQWKHTCVNTSCGYSFTIQASGPTQKCPICGTWCRQEKV